MRKYFLGLILVTALLGIGGWGANRLYNDLQPLGGTAVPVTRVKKGDVNFSVAARGNLQGGNSKVLTAPMTGSPQLIITSLRRPGETVSEGEVVAEFDTTEETFKLREAEADLAEAEQQVIQATNEALAKEEELNYELIKTRADLKLAETEMERNEFVPVMVAKQNELAREATKQRLDKLEHDYNERKAAAQASIAIQEAAKKKAQVQADTAKRNIGMMTLKAPISGYVNIERNTNSNFFYPGLILPLLQVGDNIRPGMGVVQIPDMSTWEVTAQISEEDRGQIVLGQPSEMEVVALPGRKFRGKVTNLGGTTGPPWNRRFECKTSLDDPIPEMRPGMSARILIKTEVLKEVLWIPAQALFETGGRKHVYLRADSGFTPKDVELVRRSESQVVVKGLTEGQTIALTNPTDRGETKQGKKDGGGAMKAISK